MKDEVVYIKNLLSGVTCGSVMVIGEERRWEWMMGSQRVQSWFVNESETKGPGLAPYQPPNNYSLVHFYSPVLYAHCPLMRAQVLKITTLKQTIHTGVLAGAAPLLICDGREDGASEGAIFLLFEGAVEGLGPGKRGGRL